VQPLCLRREAASEASGAVDEVPLSRYVLTLRKTLKTCVAIVGGTTGALLRGQEKLRESKTMAHTKAAALAVDEAAMMLTPHVVALATLLADEGRILLAGDHRQLGVILTHKWEEEDRPNSWSTSRRRVRMPRCRP
jgi:AAA domain